MKTRLSVLKTNSNRFVSLYPTFKEWKLILAIFKTCHIIVRLYPTFKEWKLIHSFLSFIPALCLYPTFKEWKPRSTTVPSTGYVDVFISYL